MPLQRVRAYLERAAGKKEEEEDKKKKKAYVIHGASGCGKTSLMAKVAQEAWEAQGSKGVVILR